MVSYDRFGSVDQEDLLKDFVWEIVDGSLVTSLCIYLRHIVSVDRSTLVALAMTGRRAILTLVVV